jgi:hypothetical protein
MGYGMDEEDIGGYLADQDFYAEECEGNCKKCPYKYGCQSSDYNRRRLGRWQ